VTGDRSGACAAALPRRHAERYLGSGVGRRLIDPVAGLRGPSARAYHDKHGCSHRVLFWCGTSRR